MPAFYIMFFSIIVFVAVLLMKESAHKPLLGSFPTVGSREEAVELVRTQDDNPQPRSGHHADPGREGLIPSNTGSDQQP